MQYIEGAQLPATYDPRGRNIPWAPSAATTLNESFYQQLDPSVFVQKDSHVVMDTGRPVTRGGLALIDAQFRKPRFDTQWP